jgi:cytochrome c553
MEDEMARRNIFGVIAVLASLAVCAAASAADVPAKSSSKTATNDIQRGRYVVTIAGCHDCHTPGFLVSGNRIPEKDWLTGA